MRFNHFQTPKPEGELRIVALGASMVHGSNYLYEETWPSILTDRIQRQWPDQDVSLINLGLGGAVSDEIYFYAREALQHEPDLLVVSCGFNDFVQLSRLTDFHAFSPRAMQIRMFLDRFRSARLLGNLTRSLAVLDPDPRGAWLDPEAPDEEDRGLLRRIAGSNLEGNLLRISWLSHKAGVPLLFVAQAQNEDICGPGTANGAEDSEEPDCFPPQAHEAVLRAASAVGGVPVIDAAAALRDRSTQRLIGDRWLQDVIHLTREGNAVLGEAVAPEALRLLGGDRSPSL
jgi:lysophospholipase L1-like esterase